MHIRKNWNQVNEQNSSHSSSQCQDSHTVTFQTEKSLKKVTSIHIGEFDEATSPRLKKIQSDIKKLNSVETKDVWLFVKNYSAECKDEIEQQLNTLSDLKHLSINLSGWNAKFSVKDAYKYVAEGFKYTDANQRQKFIQFGFSTKNQSQLSSPHKKANFVPKMTNFNFVEKEKVDQFKSYRQKPQRFKQQKKGSTMQDFSSYESFSPRAKKHYEQKKQKIKKYMPKSPDSKNIAVDQKV